jgi:predicted flap endonuclease-1-like 5' DNA nuclease
VDIDSRRDVTNGWAMGPMVWWWRWWLGMDPNRDQEPTGQRGPDDTYGAEPGPLSTAVQTGDDQLDQVRDEASRLRRQVTDLTRSGAEADRLRAELDQALAEAAELRTALDQTQTEAAELRTQLEQQHAETDRLRAELDGADAELRTQLEQQHAETDRLRAELDRANADGAAMRARLADLESPAPDAVQTDDAPADAAQVDDAPADAIQAEPTGRTAASPDVSEATAILGSSIRLDDLTIVDGVGPKIAGLLADAGVGTWRALADTDVDRLREVLADAGPRYRMHDPTPWPAQAALLADGRWQEFMDSKQS